MAGAADAYLEDSGASTRCLEDRYGPSTAELPAAELTVGDYGELMACAQAADWFAVRAEVGQLVRVELVAPRDLSVAWVHPQGHAVAQAQGRSVVLQAPVPLGGLRLRVEAPAQHTPYTLAVSAFEALAACAGEEATASAEGVGAVHTLAAGQRIDGLACTAAPQRVELAGEPGEALTVQLSVLAGAPMALIAYELHPEGAVETHWGQAEVGQPFELRRIWGASSVVLVLSGAPSQWRLARREDARGGAAAPRWAQQLSPQWAGLAVLAFDEAQRVVGAGRVDAAGRVQIEPGAPVASAALFAQRAAPFNLRVGPRAAALSAPWGFVLDEAGAPQGEAVAALAVAQRLAWAAQRGGALPQWPARGRARGGAQWLAAAPEAGGWPHSPPLRVRWAPGEADLCGSCFRPSAPPLIELSGAVAERDEADEAVVLHELGHWIAHVFSRDDSAGGAHDGRPAAAPLAWSEGFADFFAAWLRADPVLTDRVGTELRQIDLRAPQVQPAPLEGPLSEWAVSGLLWALAQDAAGEAALWTILFERLPEVGRGVPDLGAAGVDLADLLGGLHCLGFDTQALQAAVQLEGEVVCPKAP